METPEIPSQDENITLDKKSKILFWIVGLLIVGSVAATFWRYMVQRDYIVQAQTDCDPEADNCFVWECDPASIEEGVACTGDPESDIWYYKIIHRNAKNIPLCDPNDEECTALVCDPGEKDCSEELCSENNVPEGETCNDPEQYLLENPPEEQEAALCEDGDEECLTSQEATDEECFPDDQECLDAQSSDYAEETCPPDDPTCDQTQDSITSANRLDAETQ